MTMDAILTTIADSRQAIVVSYTGGEEINYCLLYFFDSGKIL